MRAGESPAGRSGPIDRRASAGPAPPIWPQPGASRRLFAPAPKVHVLIAPDRRWHAGTARRVEPASTGLGGRLGRRVDPARTSLGGRTGRRRHGICENGGRTDRRRRWFVPAGPMDPPTGQRARTRRPSSSARHAESRRGAVGDQVLTPPNDWPNCYLLPRQPIRATCLRAAPGFIDMVWRYIVWRYMVWRGLTRSATWSSDRAGAHGNGNLRPSSQRWVSANDASTKSRSWT